MCPSGGSERTRPPLSVSYLYGSISPSFRASASATTFVPRLWRFDLVSLLVRMWRLKALPLTILPVPVFLKRLAAPRWVFSFGICSIWRVRKDPPSTTVLLFFRDRFRHGFLRPLRRRLASRALAQDDVHLVAFLPRRRLGNGDVGQFLDQSLENAPADLGMRHLAAAEEDRRLHFVAVGEEALDVLLLELVVVHVDFRPELDLLDLDHALVFLGLAGALLFLVLVLAEVHDPADRRHRSRRNLDQVEPLLLRDGQRGGWRHDPELLPGLVDHADFSNTNALVGTNAIITSGRTIESDKSS